MLNRDDIVAAAREWLGTPYHHQASVKGVGCDCLGLVRGVYREVLGAEPETPPAYTRGWAEASGAETLIEAASRHLERVEISEARDGDVVIFRMFRSSMAKHCGVLVSPAGMIHAQEGCAVSEVWLGPYYKRRIAAAFRFPGVTD